MKKLSNQAATSLEVFGIPFKISRPFKFAIMIFWLFGSLSLSAQKDPAGFPQASLDNGEVKMQLYLPDPERGSYRATRFDWSGIISSVQFRGHEFFGYWKKTHDPYVHEDLSGPVEGYIYPGLGYEEARPGEGCIRIGVGVIEKADEEKYNGFKTYPILDHGQWTVKPGKKKIRFTHQV